ncbi:MAG: hypothetical protein KME42_05760 [Tildeniella nuda ZEHNDER 1965/U140]|nr:hypothetical protein [Tildeniella nuda ZEHNDER 1965/U140]
MKTEAWTRAGSQGNQEKLRRLKHFRSDKRFFLLNLNLCPNYGIKHKHSPVAPSFQ